MNIINSYRFAATGSPTTSDLWAWWALEDATDSHTTGRDLTNAGGNISFVTGYNNNAAEYTFASGQKLSRADNADHPTGALTVAGWFKCDAINLNRDICSKWTSTGNQRSFLLRWQGSTNLAQFFVSSNGSSSVNTKATTTMSASTWYHVAAVYDPSTAIRVYINGTMEGENTTSIPSAIYDSTSDITLGVRTDGSAKWDGLLDEFAIWERALTDDEIAWLADDHFYADL